MIVTNTEAVAGYSVVEIKGLVQGNTVRAKHAGRDIAASLKNLVGGELKGYTELLTESRRQAVERMLAQAEQLGANAILNVRFTTSAVTAGAAECMPTERLSLLPLKTNTKNGPNPKVPFQRPAMVAERIGFGTGRNKGGY